MRGAPTCRRFRAFGSGFGGAPAPAAAFSPGRGVRGLRRRGEGAFEGGWAVVCGKGRERLQESSSALCRFRRPRNRREWGIRGDESLEGGRSRALAGGACQARAVGSLCPLDAGSGTTKGRPRLAIIC